MTLPDDLPIPQTGGSELTRLRTLADRLAILAFAALSAGGSPEQASKLLKRRFGLEIRAVGVSDSGPGGWWLLIIARRWGHLRRRKRHPSAHPATWGRISSLG